MCLADSVVLDIQQVQSEQNLVKIIILRIVILCRRFSAQVSFEELNSSVS